MNSKMLFYILKRVLLALLTIWIVITVTFFVMHSIPGGPFASEKAISAEAQAALEAKYGLDKPLGEQYVTYLRDVVTKLDFGPSLKQRGRQVIDIILDGMKTSAKLGLIAAFSAAIAGIVLGALAALRRNTVLDKIIMVITTAFVSMPSFIMGSFLLIVFSVKLGWVPANGATAEGLILPVITYFGPMLAFIVTGSMVVEQIFAVPGIGRQFVSSITNRDYTMIMGTTIFLASLIVIMNLISDLLYKVVDPRIDYE